MSFPLAVNLTEPVHSSMTSNKQWIIKKKKATARTVIKIAATICLPKCTAMVSVQMQVEFPEERSLKTLSIFAISMVILQPTHLRYKEHASQKTGQTSGGGSGGWDRWESKSSQHGWLRGKASANCYFTRNIKKAKTLLNPFQSDLTFGIILSPPPYLSVIFKEKEFIKSSHWWKVDCGVKNIFT